MSGQAGYYGLIDEGGRVGAGHRAAAGAEPEAHLPAAHAGRANWPPYDGSWPLPAGIVPGAPPANN